MKKKTKKTEKKKVEQDRCAEDTWPDTDSYLE
jgi:hypothetical protein